MLLLLFETGEERYALEAIRVREIIPRVRLKKIPGTPEYVAGMMNYHGKAIPVIDVCRLISNEPCSNRFSTRIIMMPYEFDTGEQELIGLMAERITETMQSSPADLQGAGILVDEILNNMGTQKDYDQMVQLFDLKRMLPEHVLDELLRG